MTDFDYRQIEQVGVRYAAAVDECDHRAFAACFAPDGVWAVSAGDQVGREAIEEFSRRAVGHLSGTQHLVTNFLIQQDGESATMRSTFIATHIGSGDYDGQLCIIGGVYKDKLVRREGEWMFARREIHPVWVQGDTGMLGVRTRVQS